MHYTEQKRKKTKKQEIGGTETDFSKTLRYADDSP